MTANRDPDRLYEWAMRSPRKMPLEILIVLASLFWFPQFWLIEKIIEMRRRG